MTPKKLDLSSPWVIFYKEMSKMFEMDSEVKLEYDEDNYEIKLFVENTDKANALMQLLPEEKEFGNVTVKITVIPANKENMTYEELYKAAFKNNPVVSYITRGGGDYITQNETYVVFEAEVVQYFNDDLGDINRIKSTLYQDIAPDIFEHKTGVHYCTEYTKLGCPDTGNYYCSNRKYKF